MITIHLLEHFKNLTQQDLRPIYYSFPEFFYYALTSIILMAIHMEKV